MNRNNDRSAEQLIEELTSMKRRMDYKVEESGQTIRQTNVGVSDKSNIESLNVLKRLKFEVRGLLEQVQNADEEFWNQNQEQLVQSFKNIKKEWEKIDSIS